MKHFLILVFLTYIITTNSQNQTQNITKPNETNTKNAQTPPPNNQKNEKEFNLTDALEQYTENKKQKNGKSKNKQRQEEMKRDVDKIQMEQKKKERDKYTEIIKKEREECEKQLHNFTFSDFMSISIPGKSSEVLYQNITNTSKIVFGFMLSDETKQIDFTFSGPNENGRSIIINSFKDKNCMYLEYEVKYIGLYTFFINNHKNSDDSEVNFAINLGLPNDNLGTKKLDKISGILHDINKNVNNMRTKQGLINKKTEAHNDSVNKHNSEILLYSIIEVFVLIIVFFGQTIYIKGLINKV